MSTLRDRKLSGHPSWKTVVKKLLPAIATSHRFREAVERKTRRKSFNNPENIENFGDKDNNTRLEELMKLHHLQKLMKEFSYFKPPDIVLQEATSYFPAKVQKRVPGAMNMAEFKDAFSRVLETHEYDEYLEKLFQKLDTTCDGYVDWSEFCTYMLLLYRENDYMRTKREIPFLVEPKIRHIVQNKQEQSTKVLASENPSRYVTVSKEGAITVWQNNMVMEKAYTISDDDAELNAPKRRFKMWVTDAIYLPNCNKLALASTSRDIRIFDCSTNQWFEEYNLFAMSDVPYCFDYWYDKKNPAAMSVLIFGVDAGAVHVLYFKKPLTQLFETAFKSEDGAQKIFWSEVEKGGHSRYVGHEKILHDKVQQIPPHLIRQVQYIHSKNSIISSTSSPNRSIVISDINKLKKQYVFNIEKGIECFDYNQNLNILVTGSLDHIIRIWNAYVASRPIAVLEGHSTGVIGVKIHEGLMQVFSYSKDAVVKVWDIREHTCLQTVVLKFPSSIHGRMPEHGQFPMHLQLSPQDALIVTCNDYIGMLKLGQTHLPKQQSVSTHDTQLCSAIYNQLFKQVVTGCDSSNIAVWDLESGSKAIVFSNAHGEEEITCMVFDESWRRLITGARNGTIKVWNFQNGHNLHKLEAVGEAEVTGIVPVMDKNIILAVGWSRKIIVYDDSDADNLYVPANTDWKGGQLHADDILSMDFCLPQFLATGGFDGEITVWDLETEKIFVRLRRGQKPDITKKIEAIQEQHSFLSSYSTMDMLEEAQMVKSSQTNSDPRPSSNTLLSRPNSRHRKSHRIAKGQPVPVDKLLFLRSRCVGRGLEVAMLVSSEAGYLRWWCLFTAKHEMGYFYVPDTKDESVLAMCTNPSNSCLITGDTTGQVKSWDITEYCLHTTERRVKTCPPLNVSFKAHDSAVVSVEYVKHEAGEFILTASTDKTARLWTMEGHYIGTFGQKKLWNLKNKKTWCHPKTPWNETGISKLDEEKTNNKDKSDITVETENEQVKGQEENKENGEVEEEEEEEADEESVEICTGGHTVYTWNSQPKIKRMFSGNLLMSAVILISGNNFQKISLMAKFLNLGMISSTTHHRIQRLFTAPVINSSYQQMMMAILQRHRGKEIIIAGDGRNDSPGHSAMYCTYSFMEYETKDIISSVIIDKRMTQLNSTAMEKEGFIRALQYLLENDIDVKEVCTDAHPQITALLRERYPQICHSYDTWHGAKNIGKKINAVASENRNKMLRPWASDIINHFWYCSRKAEGSEMALIAPTLTALGDGGHNLNLKVRAQTIDLGSLRPERSKTFLGSKVARQLQSMKTCRMDRRNRLAEDVDFTITQRYGKLCSPFQALQTKDVVDVKLPSMPLSQRMINKGYTSDNMTEEMLRNMDFSYGNPDSPPSGDQEKKTTSVPKSDKMSTPASRRGQSRQISAIKKHNTVA